MSFRWKLGDYVGGSTAVHQAYKPFLCLRPESWAIGEFSVTPRDTSNIVISAGFQPDVLVLVSYRPKYHAGQDDGDFGNRGGGMTFGVAGRSPAAQFTGSTRIKQGWDIGTGIKLWREDVCFSVCSKDRAGLYDPSHPPIEILTLDVSSWDVGGVTLNVPTNLYDQADYVAWLAMKGTFKVGVIDAGDTSIGTGSWRPNGAMFLSVKRKLSEPDLDESNSNGSWDHMTGFASRDGGASSVWGGAIPTSWNWTTERWSSVYPILLAKAASGSSFSGATVQVEGAVTAWYEQTYILGVGQNDAGLDLQWYTFDNQPYRIGYLLSGDQAEEGVLETNWETRPGGSENIPGTDENLQVTVMTAPDVILMGGTNYNFDWSNSDPFDYPRGGGPPGGWGFGGSGGLGWHAAPFSESGYDAYGVHTFGNAVAEIGHYSNSGSQYTRRYIMAGQGSNSNPPAYHQHSVNVVPNPVIVGMNWRNAERHSTATRALVNQTDT